MVWIKEHAYVSMGQCPDLRKIDNLCYYLKIAIDKWCSTTQIKLEQLYEEEWGKVSVSRCVMLVEIRGVAVHLFAFEFLGTHFSVGAEHVPRFTGRITSCGLQQMLHCKKQRSPAFCLYMLWPVTLLPENTCFQARQGHCQQKVIQGALHDSGVNVPNIW